MCRSILAVALLVSAAAGQLPEPELRLNEDNYFELTAYGQEFAKISIFSSSASWLQTGGDPGPFSDVSVSGGYFHSEITFEIPGDAAEGVVIDGTITLDAWDREYSTGNLGFRYATLEPVERPDGLGFSGHVNEDGFLVVSGSDQEVVGLNFTSPSGALVPIPDTLVSPEFPLLLTNSPNVITMVASVGTAVTVDGDITLPVGFAGDNPTSEIVAEYGVRGSTDPVRFLLDGDIWQPEFELKWSEGVRIRSAELVPDIEIVNPIEDHPSPPTEINSPDSDVVLDPPPSAPNDSAIFVGSNQISSPVVPEPTTNVGLVGGLIYALAARRRRVRPQKISSVAA